MLVLDLSHHCIENRHPAALQCRRADLLQTGRRAPRLEKEIALLLEALETLDFSTLRSVHPALAGSTEARITLSEKESTGLLVIQIDGRPLTDLPQRKTPQRS